MTRSLALATAVAAVVALTGCPTYDRYGKLDDQGGMVNADTYARYGREEAEKIAIGRAFGQAHHGDSPADFARQVGAAVAYAHTMPDVVDVRADTAAYFLTVQFKSGWRVAILPISDGKKPGETPGLPAAAH
jgi:hypothetical protein